MCAGELVAIEDMTDGELVQHRRKLIDQLYEQPEHHYSARGTIFAAIEAVKLEQKRRARQVEADPDCAWCGDDLRPAVSVCGSPFGAMHVRCHLAWQEYGEPRLTSGLWRPVLRAGDL